MSGSAAFKYDEKEVVKLFSIHEKNQDFLSNNMNRLRSTYKNKYVAIKDEKVIAFHDDDDELHKILKKKGIDRKEVLIDFIPSSDIIYIM